MAIKANRIKIGDKLFTANIKESKKSPHKAPQEQVQHTDPEPRREEVRVEYVSPQEQVKHTVPEPRREEDPIEYASPQDQVELQLSDEPNVRHKGHSFIIKSNSKFHRDMIE